ncbi:MAG: PH domain-containing protein [Vicinamibacteria bacterium]|nr:PH domain-containing protein [Vicinamibacteria bacterium]
MFDRATAAALRWAKVSPEPNPPIGAPGSVRTFRAGRNYYYVRLLRWGATQIGAAIGIVFSIGFTAVFLETVNRVVPRVPATAASPSPSPTPGATPDPGPTPSPTSETAAAAATTASPGEAPVIAASPSPSPVGPRRKRIRVSGDEAMRQIASRMASRVPPQGMSFFRNWVVPFLLLLEFFAIAGFLLSLPFTYALVKLEFEQHWYIVTDRSLRIRTGVLSLSESTMSFANLQQVEVKQGPFQRLLGLADVRVRSAGGGDHGEEEGEPLHTGVFHSVENAEEIRDLILARLKAFREAGLGDPDRTRTLEVAAEPAHGVSAETLEAAREVLRQTRALRAATSPNG